MSNENESDTPTAGSIARDIVARPHTFPGGYRRFALVDDGALLCSDCCASEADAIEDSTPGDGWGVVAAFVHWEGVAVNCDNCNKSFDSEYGVPN
jgi:hypothetical protein